MNAKWDPKTAIQARIRVSSKYYGQGEKDALFPVCIHGIHYCVSSIGNQYRLADVDLFAINEGQKPIQITFEAPKSE